MSVWCFPCTTQFCPSFLQILWFPPPPINMWIGGLTVLNFSTSYSVFLRYAPYPLLSWPADWRWNPFRCKNLFYSSSLMRNYCIQCLLQAVNKTQHLKLPHSVHDIMNRWILQMGFPVVTIDTQTGNVSQKHFLLEPTSVVERSSEFKYDAVTCHFDTLTKLGKNVG